MSTKRLVFLVVPAAFRVLLAGFLDMLAALIFLAYRVRWLLAEVAPMTLRLVHDPDTGALNAAGGDTVELHMADALTPILVRSGGVITGLVMPMRI